MGLDMYLTRKVHISNYDFDPEGQRLARIILDALGVKGDAQAAYARGILEVSLPAAYWRKANAIHGWFVKNVQEDVDNCGTYYVSRGQLGGLRDLCSRVLDGTTPKEELPPTAGFFFGETVDDEYYRADLVDTVEKLNRVLTAPEVGEHGDSFYYQSSW